MFSSLSMYSRKMGHSGGGKSVGLDLVFMVAGLSSSLFFLVRQIMGQCKLGCVYTIGIIESNFVQS